MGGGYSPLRRWLRSMAAADNMARVRQEMAERDRGLRRQQSETMSDLFGFPVDVGPPQGFTFPHFAVEDFSGGWDNDDGKPIAPNPSHPLDPDHWR